MTPPAVDEKRWQKGKSRDECHRYMLEHQVACDVQIRCSGSDRLIGAHRYMLICRSPTFESMLTADEVMRSVGDVINIDLPGTDPDILMEILRYIYYDGGSVLGENVISVLHAATKYQLDGLIARCLDYVGRNLSAGNACTLLSTCSVDEVLELCVRYVSNHPAHVLGSDHFLGLTQRALYKLLTADILYDHGKVIEAALRWAKHQWQRRKAMTSPEAEASVREILGPCLYQLGFTSLTPAQLVTVTKETAVLSDAEQLALFRYAAMPEAEVVSSLAEFGFRLVTAVYTTPSCYMSQTQSSVPSCGQVTSTLTFALDNAIVMRGFAVFGTTKTATYRLNVELTREKLPSGEDELVDQFQTTVWSRGSQDAIRIALPAAVQLLPAVVYRLLVVMSEFKETSNKKYYKGVDRQSHVVSQGCTLTLSDDQSDVGRFIAQIIYSVKGSDVSQ